MEDWEHVNKYENYGRPLVILQGFCTRRQVFMQVLPVTNFVDDTCIVTDIYTSESR